MKENKTKQTTATTKQTNKNPQNTHSAVLILITFKLHYKFLAYVIDQ